MYEYHKINSIFKRDENGKIIPWDFSIPEFEYLQENIWEFTEKIDGTNIRIIWQNGQITFAGKTNRAQIPLFLLDKLHKIFDDKTNIFNELFQDKNVCLYGEGYGNRIQSVGKLYIPNDVNFILFDVLINGIWLLRKDIDEIAIKLNIKSVPSIGEGNFKKAVAITANGFNSNIGNLKAEGMVLRPKVELKDRFGNRIITKIKTKDFIGISY